MKFDDWIKENLAKGIKGKVKWNPDEDCYVLDLGHIDIGIHSDDGSFYSEFEGEEIELRIRRTKANIPEVKDET